MAALRKRLRSRKVQTRLEALAALIRSEPTPVSACEALVAALEDPAKWDEEYRDWDGSVAGGHTTHVAEEAAVALGGAGVCGLWSLLDAIAAGAAGAREQAARVVERLSADALAEASPEDREQARRAVAQAGAPHRRELALANLAWAAREGEERRPRLEVLVARLTHPDPREQARAARALEEATDPGQAAAALADTLLSGASHLRARSQIGRSLHALGPVLDEERLSGLLERASAGEPYLALPGLLRALAEYGDRVFTRLDPILGAWVDRRLSPLEPGDEHKIVIREAARQARRTLDG